MKTLHSKEIGRAARSAARSEDTESYPSKVEAVGKNRPDTKSLSGTSIHAAAIMIAVVVVRFSSLTWNTVQGSRTNAIKAGAVNPRQL